MPTDGVPVCAVCGTALRLAWRVFANGTRHIEGTCPVCRAFRGWVPQTQEAVAGADRTGSPSPPPGPGLFDDVD